jgi:hypothetical protein
MAKAVLKTVATTHSVETFVSQLPSTQQREDCTMLIAMMQRATNAPARMWGPSIVGFGQRHIVYDSGRELDWFVVGFAPRKGKLVIYLPDGVATNPDLLARLGKHTTGVGCLNIPSTSSIDGSVLEQIIRESVRAISTKGH